MLDFKSQKCGFPNFARKQVVEKDFDWLNYHVIFITNELNYSKTVYSSVNDHLFGYKAWIECQHPVLQLEYIRVFVLL